MSSPEHFDICIVGAGVIGLAIAFKLTHHPACKDGSILVLEQHKSFGEETSSRNSEVIHAGIYYPAGSLKAKTCVDGKQQLYAFCNQYNVPHRKIGKLIIAGKDQESALQDIKAKASANGVDDLRPLEGKDLLTLEPALKASCGLFSPTSGIIDSHAYMQTLLTLAENGGALFAPGTRVCQISRSAQGYDISTDCQGERYTFQCDKVVNSAGLYAQELAGHIADFPLSEVPVQQRVKGSYFTLQGHSPFRHLIYPMPEANLKGLGVHVTLDMGGQVRFGPDTEEVEAIDYTVNSDKESSFRQTIAAYYPDIAKRQIQPGYSGIRPKIAHTQGVVDFHIREYAAIGFPGLVQLFGIESPGLTASLAIADAVTQLLKP